MNTEAVAAEVERLGSAMLVALRAFGREPRSAELEAAYRAADAALVAYLAANALEVVYLVRELAAAKRTPGD